MHMRTLREGRRDAFHGGMFSAAPFLISCAASVMQNPAATIRDFPSYHACDRVDPNPTMLRTRVTPLMPVIAFTERESGQTGKRARARIKCGSWHMNPRLSPPPSLSLSLSRLLFHARYDVSVNIVGHNSSQFGNTC